MKDQIVFSFPMKILKVSRPCTVFKIAKSFEQYTYCHSTAPSRYGADSDHGSKLQCYVTSG